MNGTANGNPPRNHFDVMIHLPEPLRLECYFMFYAFAFRVIEICFFAPAELTFPNALGGL